MMSKSDLGHINLIRDLEKLLEEAKNYEFHDFKNTKYAFPKNALSDKLRELDTRNKTGEYDN